MRLRYLVFFEYVGNAFPGGSVKQLTEPLTVQETLEGALNKLFMDATSHVEQGVSPIPPSIRTYFSSRTDVGVHALKNALHVDLDRGDVTSKKAFSPTTLMQAWNAYLGITRSTQILSSYVVADDVHARHAAISRQYLYRIHCYSGSPPLHDRIGSWMLERDLNEDLMRQASYIFLGEHDFTSFRGSSCQAKSSIRSIDMLDVVPMPPTCTLHVNSKIIHVLCRARSFLYHQIRNIVSTLVAVGTHQLSIDDVYRILKSKNRRLAPDTAPAQGLYLQDVIYPASIFDHANHLEYQLKSDGLMDLREAPRSRNKITSPHGPLMEFG